MTKYGKTINIFSLQSNYTTVRKLEELILKSVPVVRLYTGTMGKGSSTRLSINI